MTATRAAGIIATYDDQAFRARLRFTSALALVSTAVVLKEGADCIFGANLVSDHNPGIGMGFSDRSRPLCNDTRRRNISWREGGFCWRWVTLSGTCKQMSMVIVFSFQSFWLLRQPAALQAGAQPNRSVPRSACRLKYYSSRFSNGVSE